MSKTKELSFNCTEVRTGLWYNKLRVVIDDPNIDELLACIDTSDLIAHILADGNSKPEDVYDQEVLEKWAEENGYTKQ